MRVPLSWLRDYVAFDLAPQVLAEELTLRGLEVSSIEVTGADWKDVVVGRLLSVERHPNADKLWLTSVDAGTGTPLQIVCGADNIAVGQLVPVALVGSVLAGGRRIERSKIRGVESQGMLCSAIELGLGEDAAGIHILGRGDELTVGTDLATILGEVVLDVDVKPNRGDALSMVGLAREVAALVGASVQMPDASVAEDPSLPVADRVSVAIEDPEGCPRFTARLFEGVANGASPAWMQARLLAAGMRPISAVVDVTNYVMHELGQPMHAYDADAVPDGRIVVRRARPGEALETIDHERRTLDERMLVIADAERRHRPRRDHGRGEHRGEPRHDPGDPGVGHLPRADDPQHGAPPRPALGGEPPPREGDRAPPAAARGRSSGTPHRRDHRRAGRGRHRRQRPAAPATPGRGRGRGPQ